MYLNARTSQGMVLWGLNWAVIESDLTITSLDGLNNDPTSQQREKELAGPGNQIFEELHSKPISEPH